jgi:F0F1-type ATP synthase membrane subunit c/vacuolar-type H+-ATPase subunit K
MQYILVFHNLIRWAILLVGVWTVINALSGVISKRSFSSNDNRSNLLFMIFCDVQLLFGLILLFSNGWFDKIKSGMGEVMKNNVDRFFIVEHGLMMIIAWILVHVGRTAVKKAPENSKHKKMLLFFGLALLLILASIPWSFKGEVARPMMRWFN